MLLLPSLATRTTNTTMSNTTKQTSAQKRGPHRPDITPQKGYRLLEMGELPIAGDEAKIGPFGEWLPVECGRWKVSPFQTPMNENCAPVRRKLP
jgi:hypothetical protein